MDLISQNIVLINSSRTAWNTWILMLFLKLLGQVTMRCIIIMY